MAKLTHYIIHCMASREDVPMTSDQIRQMHLGPHELTEAEITQARKRPGANLEILRQGVLRYNGDYFADSNHLPITRIGGVLISSLIGGRGWRQVGYADMIHLDGRIENLVPYNEDENVDPWEISNGILSSSELYDNARHISYVGGMDKAYKYPKDTRTPEQLISMTNKVKETIDRHPDILVIGHNQINDDRACPSFNVPNWLRSIGIPEKNISKAPVLYKGKLA